MSGSMRVITSSRRALHLGLKHRTRRAASSNDLFVALSMVALVLIFLNHYMRPSCGLSSPTKIMNCQYNLRQIGTHLLMYAYKNRQQFPVIPHKPPTRLENGSVTYAPNLIGKYRERPSTSDDDQLSMTRHFWLLFQEMGPIESPDVFICPGTMDVAPGQYDARDYYDFEAYTSISYGYQVSFGQKGGPSMNVRRPAEFILSADKGPYGAALEAGAPFPDRTAMPSPTRTGSWQPYNSPNHDGKQNATVYLDGHVETHRTPLACALNDNIYTRWEDPSAATTPIKRTQGASPTSNETPLSDQDTLIYP